jgi:hypothetical protein
MDLLESERVVTSFVLMGICSGGQLAIRVAHLDSRVVGVAVINGTVEAGQEGDRNRIAAAKSRHRIRYYLSRLWRPRSWIRFLCGRSDYRAFGRTILWLGWRLVARPLRAVEESARPSEIARLGERGVPVLIVLSEGSIATDVSAPFLRSEARSLVEAGKLRVEFIRGCDHVFTLLWSQRRLVEVIRTWMARWRASETASLDGPTTT